MKTVFLIDDSEPDNFLHSYLIEKTGKFGKVTSVLNVEQALDQLKEMATKNESMPDIIILDINMPRMNGWEFLDVAKTTTEFDISNSDIYMLSTSLDPDDKIKAMEEYGLKGFFRKPLTLDQISLLEN